MLARPRVLPSLPGLSTQDGDLTPDVVAALQTGFCEAGNGTQTDKYLDMRAALGRFIGVVRQQWACIFSTLVPGQTQASILDWQCHGKNT